MRRRKADQAVTGAGVSTCPACGAAARAEAHHCTSCGAVLAAPPDASRLWGSVSVRSPRATSTPAPSAVPDGDATSESSSEVLASLRADLDAKRVADSAPGSDPWAAKAGKLATVAGSTTTSGWTAPMGIAAATNPPRRRGRGLLRLLLVLLMVGGAVWFGARPALNQRLADAAGPAIDDRLDGIASLRLDATGQLTVAERDLNRALQADADAYAPITSPTVSLRRSGMRITFSVLGVKSVLSGQLAVRRGVVVLVDPIVTGPASRLLDLDPIVASAEESLADLFARMDVQPVSVDTSDDVLIIGTTPVVP